MHIILNMITLFSIGQSIQKARKSAGYTVIELAFRSGLSRNTISNLEAGRGNVELNTIISICHALNLSLQFVPEEQAAMPQHREMQNTSPLQRLINSRLDKLGTVQAQQRFDTSKLAGQSLVNQVNKQLDSISNKTLADQVNKTLADQFKEKIDAMNQASETMKKTILADKQSVPDYGNAFGFKHMVSDLINKPTIDLLGLQNTSNKGKKG